MNKLKDFFTARRRAFGYAFQGWLHVLRTQRNAWIHALATVLAVLLAAWLKLPARDWAVMLLAIAIVWTSEFINTSIETIIDLVSPGQHPLAKAGKDVAAAAVLIAALTSVLVGLLILGPPLWAMIQGWLVH